MAAVRAFFSTAGGHWILVLFGYALLGLIFHDKPVHLGLACALVLGAAFATGFIDGWIVVIFAAGLFGLVMTFFGLRSKQ